MEDHEIVTLFNNRDEQAIRETQHKYGRLCLAVASRIVGNRMDAEEIVNDGFLRLWDSIPPAAPESLQAYLCRIVRNLSINRYRFIHSKRRNRELETSLEELAEVLPAPEENEADALSAALNEFLASLTETDRRLFMGRYWYACSVGELAKTYGMTEDNVSVRLHRVRECLRTYMNERGYAV